MKATASGLLGTWRQVSPAEAVTVRFAEDGTLTYVVHTETGEQIIKLVYEVGDGVIVTDQPSRPGAETTAFEISAEDVLTLNYDGEITTFVRAGERGGQPHE